ncbi:MAG: hypothetical protein F4Y17_09975, partial [Gemmatimonadetes bacterium]|nr:hypothetical protein [Gemmatimonadota bacterium]
MGSNSIFNDVETPAVLLDETRMMGNLRAMQDLADRHGVSLRPHIKTHKSLEIGRRQIALGASGVTVPRRASARHYTGGSLLHLCGGR